MGSRLPYEMGPLPEVQRMKVCCFCGLDAGEYGNNPEPLFYWPRVCCDGCNLRLVIPARLRALQ